MEGQTEVVAPVAPVAPPSADTAPIEAKPERTFTQAELDEILEKRLAKERRKRGEIETRLRVTEELALRGKEPREPAPQKQPDGEPRRDQFDTYEAYLEARTDYRADKKVEERLAKQREEETRTRTEAEQRKQAETFRAKADKFASTTEDFHEVMEASTAPLTREMQRAIVSSEDSGPAIAYHLAKNPEEAERIAALPEAIQAREIWKLESKLQTQKTAVPSKAPAPIDPVRGKTTGVDDPEPTDPDKWRIWREKQIRAKRG